ncbi:disheveled-associated activator of morphogenesis 1-A-like isoform X3 [Tigriopus californicus]|nr:disheveled-associated activator of morphogenesis 1-A-like isoform X3 [Tigriopus californicus]
MEGVAHRLARKGWCSCLKDSEPPEITYCVVDGAGTLNLQTVPPTQPMPDEEELDEKFAELVEELDLSAPNKSAMLSLPNEKKWQIYCSQKGKQGADTNLSNNPETYIEKVKELAMMRFCQENDEIRNRARQIDSLQIALRTQPNSFVTRFMEVDGLSSILNFLSSMDYETRQSVLHTAVLGCLKAMMNNSTGRSHVLAHPTGINIIAQSLNTENNKTKIAILELLGAICLVPGGHKKVLEAMLHYQVFAHERTRFQGIVNDLDRSTGKYRDDVNLKTAIMSFVNAVLNYGHGQDNLEFRIHLRYEFLMLGIHPVIDKLRQHENETLNRHLDFFEMVRLEDEKELAKRFDQVHVDTKSASAMFEILRKKLNHTSAFPHFLSMLQHCILLPLDYGAQPQYWHMFDKVVQQLVLQSENHEDHDVTMLDINVRELVEQLAKEEEYSQLQNRVEELEKENSEYQTNLAKKEQELDAKTQEKEDLESNLERTKEKLELELARFNEAKQRFGDFESSQHTTLVTSSSSVSFAPPAPPPPAPPMAPPPPGPPPPPMIGGGSLSLLPKVGVRKNIPQSSNPLKSFNWSKLPDCKVQGTIWTELEETKLYKTLDLAEVDKLFSAYQKNGLLVDGSIEDLRSMGTLGRRNKIISVIDSRRAQNCTILLSKLKLSNEEITKAIMSMDSRDQFPADMVEQMLKFTPTPEERALLDEHADEIDHLARADRFLFELSKITHYEQRLRTLHYKKKFHIWFSEIKPKIQAVLEASKEVQRSKRLKKMLEIILAFGNYMNRGQRGNAVGFKLSSLTRIADTKSSCNKNMTLLHYIADTCNDKFRECLMLDADLPHIKDASKVNMKELEKDMNMLRNGMKEVEREIEFFRTQPASNGDRYLLVMKEFSAKTGVRLSELEDLFIDMKARFDRVCKLFSDDPATTHSDEFFGVFDLFITTFNEAKQENDNIKKKKEEEEKITKQQQELRMRTLERKKSTSRANGLNHRATGSITANHGSEKNEFDDLISALRTGDVFGENMDKFRRNRKIRNSPPRMERMDSFMRERNFASREK